LAVLINSAQRGLQFYFIPFFFKKKFQLLYLSISSLKIRFFAILILSATFVLPIFADDDDLAIPPGDIPITCLVTCAAVVQQANTCQALAAAAAPADDDKRR
jgi:hypothetical protein